MLSAYHRRAQQSGISQWQLSSSSRAATAHDVSFVAFPRSQLRDAALAPATLRAYTLNLDRFLHFTRLDLPHLTTLTPTQIDLRLSEYIDASFASRGSYDYACQALFGLVYQCPALRYQLGESRLRLRGWKRLKTHRSHPPVTWELTAVFSTITAKWGRHAEAVGTLLAFDCYLRVGELTRLTYSDVILPNDPRTGSAHKGMALRLATTKTGDNQWVAVSRSVVANTLQEYLLAYPFLSSDRIFPFTPSAFRHLLHDVTSSVGLQEVPYVPHSFRHGGATCDFLLGATIEQIQFRGRWESMRST
jgi:integrase